jgi:GNAT superfamily N-acetyltransferase
MSPFDRLDILPATPQRWPDLEALFGPRGACAGCWCVYWRLAPSDYRQMDSAARKSTLQRLTGNDPAPGLIAYASGQPAAWVSIGPRHDYPALEASRLLKRVDDIPVWSVVCFFVARPFRKQGLMTPLLRSAMQYAIQHGAQVIEAYPTDMQSEKRRGHRLTGPSGCIGIASVFRSLGFVPVAQVSDTQLMMRFWVA